MQYTEALEESIKYFEGDELAAKVFLDKYALRDENDNILESTPRDMHKRLAKEFAKIEADKFDKPLTEEEIFNLFDKFKYIVPQGSPMFGIGNSYQYISIGNCFVLPSPSDSILGINYLDTQIAAISARRGGVGWDISSLRPAGLGVKNAAKTTTGAVSFMDKFSNTIRTVCQNGRRGASLQSISVHHPEVMDFIKCKRNKDKITGSNITIQFTDEFMNALEKDEEYEQRWPVDSNEPIIKKMVKASDIWKEFIISARDFAEPGACYIDTVHSESTGYHHGQIESSSNPCGEQYLPPYASCRLICINLLSYVENAFTNNASFNFDLFYNHCYLMQRIADDMIDIELKYIDKILNKLKRDNEPDHIKQIGIDLWTNIRKTTVLDRRTGCGFTGLGDCLAALNIKYGDDESLKVTEKIQKTFKHAAYNCSVDMAEVLGSFPDYDWSNDIKSNFIKRMCEEDPKLEKRMKKFGRRNMVLLTIAPTGSVSCLTQTTSGLEPVFLLEYTRRKKVNPSDKNVKIDFVDQNGDHWQEFIVRHKGLQDFIDINNKTLEESPYFEATANEIDWNSKTKLQGILQKHTDNSISVTTNLPHDISYEEVDKIYRNSWKNGCKGCTVYRDGCRTGVLVKNEPKVIQTNATKRPKILNCDIYNFKHQGNKYTVIVGLFENYPYEVFCVAEHIEKHKTGQLIKEGKGRYILKCEDEILQLTNYLENDAENALLRMISTSLRHGSNIKFIVEQLNKTKGDLTSFTKCIARALKKYIDDGSNSSEDCPNCSSKLIYQEGCLRCDSCGFSKC